MENVHQQKSFRSKNIFVTDYKTKDVRYITIGMIMAVLGGFLAYIFRYGEKTITSFIASLGFINYLVFP